MVTTLLVRFIHLRERLSAIIVVTTEIQEGFNHVQKEAGRKLPKFEDLCSDVVFVLIGHCLTVHHTMDSTRFAFQFYLFSTDVPLEMINLHKWGFGQIAAVTVWLPPVIEYMPLQLSVSSSRFSDVHFR